MAPEALQWWDEVLHQVMDTYGRWLEAGPIERLHIEPPSDEACSSTPLRRRMTLRASTLLMNAMPPRLREELVASRTLSTSGILFKILRNYQPGGTAEKAETLQALTVAKAAKTPREAVDKIRKWRRHHGSGPTGLLHPHQGVDRYGTRGPCGGPTSVVQGQQLPHAVPYRHQTVAHQHGELLSNGIGRDGTIGPVPRECSHGRWSFDVGYINTYGEDGSRFRERRSQE